MDRVELLSDKEGYAYITVADTSPLTLASMKEAVAKTPFALADMAWTIQTAEKHAEKSP